ncbi:unnamed protein product [Rhizophagus irregularis]|nr:unnamed protein product [Rhizophagus irregularis]
MPTEELQWVRQIINKKLRQTNTPPRIMSHNYDDVFEQVKDFNHNQLTKEQKSLIDKLITDEELKICYKYYGLCKKCNQPRRHDYDDYCNYCHFQSNFENWTSGNHNVDEFIQKTQLRAEFESQIIEWIEYDKFKDVKYLAKGGFGTIFKAVWKYGPWILNSNYQLERESETKVALKCLHNLQDITADFLKEEVYSTNCVVRCFGIAKNPKQIIL